MLTSSGKVLVVAKELSGANPMRFVDAAAFCLHDTGNYLAILTARTFSCDLPRTVPSLDYLSVSSAPASSVKAISTGR